MRTTKYGETSIIVNLFTEILGVQTYIVNGIRQRTKKTGSTAMLFEPGNMLQVVAYANEHKNMNRLKEFEFAALFKTIPQSVVKNAVLTFCVELTSKSIQEPAPMPEVFLLLQNMTMLLDAMPVQDVYNFPMLYMVQLAQELGFGIQGLYAVHTPYLNVMDGIFQQNFINSTINCSENISHSISNLLQTDIENAATITLLDTRKNILESLLQYLQLHISNINTMRSPQILQSIFE